MTYTLELASVPIEVEYRNVKTLRLTVYSPDGRVVIAAPLGTAPASIKEFAASKTRWIEEQRGRILSRSGDKKAAAGSLRNHSAVYVWGAALELELVERRGNSKIVIDKGQGRMTMYVRPDSPRAKRQEFLDRWRRRILKEAAAALIKKWEAVIGVEVKKLYVRKMRTHWGSCNYGKQTLRLNSELTKQKPECLEYVIVHEMLHIIEKGHNRSFYHLLDKYIPDWKVIRKKMNSTLP